MAGLKWLSKGLWVWYLNIGSQERRGWLPPKKCDLQIELWESQSKQLAETRANQYKLNVPLENWRLGISISVDDLNRVTTVDLTAHSYLHYLTLASVP